MPEKIKAMSAELNALRKLNIQDWRYKQRLEETQLLSGELLDAQAELGEMIKNTPDFHSSGQGTMKRKELPEGITKKLSHQLRQLAEYKEIIGQVKAEAEKEDDLPTRTEVLKRIKEKERNKKK